MPRAASGRLCPAGSTTPHPELDHPLPPVRTMSSPRAVASPRATTQTSSPPIRVRCSSLTRSAELSTPPRPTNSRSVLRVVSGSEPAAAYLPGATCRPAPACSLVPATATPRRISNRSMVTTYWLNLPTSRSPHGRSRPTPPARGTRVRWPRTSTPPSGSGPMTSRSRPPT